MATTPLAGLSSGFDWQTFIDTIVAADSVPINRLKVEQATNTRKTTALTGLASKITDLQTSAKALAADGLFDGRSAASTTTGSGWTTAASSGTYTGNYTFAISQLATRTTLTGTTGVSKPLNATNDVSGVTIGTMNTAATVTAGNFTVNGKQIAVALTDSLKDIFDRISTATGGAVTASYNSATDKISLSSASEIVLGASNDTSNFLSVAHLANTGATSISSETTLGTAKLNTTLASSTLKKAITAVDGAGDGSFSINGVAIAFNVNTDTLSSVITKINNSSAGVTASYDAASDGLKLTNDATGNLGLGISDVAGGFLDAVGLLSGTSSTRGKNTLFSVNGGPQLSATGTTLDASVTGITGLSVTATTETTETISVTSDTTSMTSAINDFISKFNTIQTYIDDQTKISVDKSGKVTTALMAQNQEIQNWASSFRHLAFGAISGLSGTITRLNDLGIDFISGSSQLSVKDSTKLNNALNNKSTDLKAFFSTATTGFAAQFKSLTEKIIGTSGDGNGGWLAAQTDTLTKQNKDIDTQIAVIQRQVDSEKARLTASFTAMETANAKIKQMQQQLSSAFSSSSTSSSSS